MFGHKLRADSVVIGILVVTVVVLSATVVHLFFSRAISNLTIEVLAAIIAVVLVVASVAVTIHFQSRAETHQEYRVELFRNKIASYSRLLKVISRVDDDETITDDEIEKIRNGAQTIALYADPELIRALASFINRLAEERLLYMPDRDGSADGTLRSVVQAMRNDLAVVEGDKVIKEIGSLVKKESLQTQSEQSLAIE